LVVGINVEGGISDRVKELLVVVAGRPLCALARSVTAAVTLSPTLSPATGETRGVQAVLRAVLCHPLHDGIVLLAGGGILGLGREAVVGEDDGGLRAAGLHQEPI
jgi:hypothetical protein